jgi:hypothetical protein
MRAETLQWAGNAARMFCNIILKRIVEGSLGGRRPAGKPRDRWKDEVQKVAAKLLSAKNWRVAARYNVTGGKKTGETMAQNGPKNHTKKKPNGYLFSLPDSNHLTRHNIDSRIVR